MTVLLVLAMVVAAMTVHLYMSSRRRRAAERARNAVRFVEVGRASLPAHDALFHPGHTWVQLHGDDLASIGASAFAANFVGEIASVETPPEGQRLKQAEPACTLVSARGRRLSMPSPIEGEVLAVNERVKRDPRLLAARPYDEGWILRVKPRRVKQAVKNLLPATSAERWIDAARAELAACTGGLRGAVAFDGGEWVAGFGDRIEDRDWELLRERLFPEGSRAAETARRDESRGAHDAR
jgi:glycine cleavage system H protein